MPQRPTARVRGSRPPDDVGSSQSLRIGARNEKGPCLRRTLFLFHGAPGEIRTPDLLVRRLRLFRMQPLVAKRKNDACGGEYFPRIGGRNSLFLQDRREEYSASPRCPGPFAGGSRRLPLGNLSGNDHSHFWLIVPVPAGLLSWVSGNHAEFAPDSGRCRRRIDPFQTFSSTGTAAVHLQARDMEVGNPHSANLRCAMSAPTAARGYRISALSGTNPSDAGFPTATAQRGSRTARCRHWQQPGRRCRQSLRSTDHHQSYGP